MPIISPLQVIDGQDFALSSVHRVNGVPFNFGGYSGVWTIKRGETLILSGLVTLGTFGQWSVAFNAASTVALRPVTEERGYTLNGVSFVATITNGTDTLIFQSAVQLIRDKTTFPTYAGGEYAVLPNDPEAVNATQIATIEAVVEDVLATKGGLAPPTYFRQSDYTSAADLALIRAGIATGQNVTAVTNALRTMHEAALAYFLAQPGACVVVLYEAGTSLINRRLMSDAFNNALWAASTQRNCRIQFASNGPVRWVISNWQDGAAAVRTDGMYGELGITYAVPQSVWEWQQKTRFTWFDDFSAKVNLVGAGNELTDPQGMRTYGINASSFTGQFITSSLRNIGHHHESMWNTRFEYMVARAGTGWQPTEHGKAGIVDGDLRYINTGATVTITDSAGTPVSFLTSAHIGLKIALDRQGVSQISDDPDAEGERRGPKWFTITGVSGNSCTVTPTPDYNGGTTDQMVIANCRFSFDAVRASVTAGSTTVTLSAPVVGSLVGRRVSVVGAGYDPTGIADWKLARLGDDLSTIVTAHTGNTLTLAHKAGRTRANAPIIISPQVAFGPQGPAILHSSWNPVDDVHVERLWCEANAYGAVMLHAQSCTGFTTGLASKLHGSPPTTNNWAGNFCNVAASRLSGRLHALFSHGMHSPYFGKFVFSGAEINTDLIGELVSWTSTTLSSRYYFDVSTSPDQVYVYEQLTEQTVPYPSLAAGQVIERGTGYWSPALACVRSAASARTPETDEPVWPIAKMGPISAPALGTTRALAVSAIAQGWVPQDGVIYSIGGLQYIGAAGSTAISDLPGLAYYGDAVSVSPPSAATLIAAAALAGRKSVTLRQVLGSGYTEAQDGAAILNAVLPALSTAGIAVTNAEALSVSLQSTLYWCDGLNLDGGGSLIFWRDVASSSPIIDTRNYQTGGETSDMKIRGFTLMARDTSKTGQMIRYMANRSTFDRINVMGYNGGQGWLWGGSDVVMRDCWTSTGQTSGSGDGAYRCQKALRCTAIGCYGRSNDDVFQFVQWENAPVGSALYGANCLYSQYVGCTGESINGRLCIVDVSGRNIDANPMPSQSRGLSFIGVKGKSKLGLVVVHEESDGTQYLTDDINFIGVDVEVTGTGYYGGTVRGTVGVPDAVGRVSFSQCSIRAAGQNGAMLLNADGATVSLDRCHMVADQQVLYILAGRRTSIVGGRYEISAGGVSDLEPIYVHTTATGHTLDVSGVPILGPLATSRAGITVSAGQANIVSARIIKAAGATSTVAVRPGAAGVSATLTRNGIEGDFDTLYSTGAGTVRVIEGPMALRSGGVLSSIVSDLASLSFRDANLLETEGLASTDNLAGLSPPPNIQVGDIAPISINNSSRTVTVLHNQTVSAPYYPIKTSTGANVTLTSTSTVLNLMWMGTYWDDLTWQTPTGAVLTVATLPSAATAGTGARQFVTDASATTFGSTVAGGGSNRVPVYSDGTNWKIG